MKNPGYTEAYQEVIGLYRIAADTVLVRKGGLEPPRGLPAGT